MAPWVQEKSPYSALNAPGTTTRRHSASLDRASSASAGHLGLRPATSANVAHPNVLAHTASRSSSRTANTHFSAPSHEGGEGRIRGSRSAQGLATVGLGNFKIGALHDMLKHPGDGDVNADVDCDDGFFPGGLDVPDSFKGGCQVSRLFVACCAVGWAAVLILYINDCTSQT